MANRIERRTNREAYDIKAYQFMEANEAGQLEFLRVLHPYETYRVYSYSQAYGGQYALGSSLYITNIPGYIKYETPPKELLKK
jgi:hypothetical protein